MKKIPQVSISRLAVYLRLLKEWEDAAKFVVSSQDLAKNLDINPNQVRKDLSYFGQFGRRGIGYQIYDLKNKINKILGLYKDWNICICGIGNLGSALLSYTGFRQMKLNILALFDSDPAKIGKRKKNLIIYDKKLIPKIIKQKNIEIAIITVPATSAKEIANQLILAGIKAILNFAPVKLTGPKYIKIKNIDLSTELIILTHFLSAVNFSK